MVPNFGVMVFFGMLWHKFNKSEAMDICRWLAAVHPALQIQTFLELQKNV